jgi:mannose-6-phosphate isomerase-like protein (cupin superfamily)
MEAGERSGVITLAEFEAQVPGPEGERSVLALKRGTLDIRLSVPLSPNIQVPHEQDEVYFVVHGQGVLVHDGERTRFGPGDILFVAAGVDHHYADFSSDLALWRVFYGAPGGEVP